MSNWFKELKEQTSTFIETFKGDEETMVKAEEKEVDKNVESYRSKLQPPQKSLSETMLARKDGGMNVTKSTNVIVMEPRNEDDAYLVIDQIKAKNIVLMKLEKAEEDSPAAITHIVSGACHLANVAPMKVGPLMLLIDAR